MLGSFPFGFSITLAASKGVNFEYTLALPVSLQVTPRKSSRTLFPNNESPTRVRRDRKQKHVAISSAHCMQPRARTNMCSGTVTAASGGPSLRGLQLAASLRESTLHVDQKIPRTKRLIVLLYSSTVSVHQHLPDALEHFTTIASCLAVLEFFSSAQSVASLLIGADTPAPQRRLLSDPFTWSIFLIGDCGKPPGVTIQIEMAKSCALGSGFSGIPKGSR